MKKNEGNMADFQNLPSPESLVKPAATIASGAFLLSPFGIPFFIGGVPRIILAGLGGFLAGTVAEKVAETVLPIISGREDEA